MNTNPNNGGFSYKGKENYLQVNTEDSRRIEGRYSPVQNCINKGLVPPPNALQTYFQIKDFKLLLQD